MRPWYNVRKAAQVTAFFAHKEGGEINVLKAAKLLYLADRNHMKKYDFPILNDEFVSMAHGPVTSSTLDCINGLGPDDCGDWNEYITDRHGHLIALASPSIDISALDELSKAELQTLQETWDEFGKMQKYEIRDWTHNHCREWEDPKGSSNPIPYERVFKFLGKENASALEEAIMQSRDLCSRFSTHQ